MVARCVRFSPNSCSMFVTFHHLVVNCSFVFAIELSLSLQVKEVIIEIQQIKPNNGLGSFVACIFV